MTIRGPWYSFGSTDCAFGYEGNVDLLDRFVTCHQTIYYPSNTERISLQLLAGILVAGNIIIIIIIITIIIITIIIITTTTIIIIIIINNNNDIIIIIIIIINIDRVNIWSSILLHLPTAENGCYPRQDRATSIETVIRRIATTITVQIVVVVVVAVVIALVLVVVVLLSVIILITMMMMMMIMFFCKKCKK